MSHAAKFTAFGALYAGIGLWQGGLPGCALLWLGASFMLVGLAYARGDARAFGKGDDGTLLAFLVGLSPAHEGSVRRQGRARPLAGPARVRRGAPAGGGPRRGPDRGVPRARAGGRSAMAMAAVLIRKGLATGVEEAVALIKAARPGAALSLGQLRALRDLALAESRAAS